MLHQYTCCVIKCFVVIPSKCFSFFGYFRVTRPACESDQKQESANSTVLVYTQMGWRQKKCIALVGLYVVIADHNTKYSRRWRSLFSALQHHVDLKEPDVSGGICRLRLGARRIRQARNMHKSTACSLTLMMDKVCSSETSGCRRGTHC
jgi:hypothetical protein